MATYTVFRTLSAKAGSGAPWMTRRRGRADAEEARPPGCLISRLSPPDVPLPEAGRSPTLAFDPPKRGILRSPARSLALAAVLSVGGSLVPLQPAHSATLDPGAPGGPGAAGALSDLGPWGFYEKLRAATPAGTATLHDFSFARDAGRFTVKAGTLTLVQVEDRLVGGVLEGTGTFAMAPPDPVEQWQMRHLFDSTEVVLQLTGAFLLFDDGMLGELRSSLEFGASAPGRNHARIVEDALGYLTDRDKRSGDREIVRTFLNGEGGGFFHVHMQASGGPWYFRYSEFSAEEVSFGRKGDGKGDFYEPLSSFHKAGDYPAPDPLEDPPVASEVMHYDIEAWIRRGPDFTARTTLALQSELAEGDWVPFSISSDLVLDSLRWDDGSAVTMERGEKSAQFWVRLPAVPALRRLTAWYHGKVVEYHDLFYWFDDPTGWYPSTGRTDATFAMTFHVDDRYGFLASGTLQGEETSDGMVTTRWALERPESQASFNLGNFKEHGFAFRGIPPVRLQVNEEFHKRLLEVSARTGRFLQDKGAADAVARDLASSLSFFQGVYGPLDVTSLNASEIPYGHGQAFPQLIHLSWATFLNQGKEDDGEDEMFRAHEVAHQWWGLSVEPRSYRDLWLSEGVAQFSGMWFMQVARTDPERYFKKLEETRDAIVRRRDKAGPIALGARVSIGNRDEDHSTIVYDKGAWVVHMLRNLFMDTQTLDEKAFRALMADAVKAFRHRRVSTQEFQQLVETHLSGTDMQWFFDQWVYGASVPTYRWAWNGVEGEGGYRVTVRVRQEDVGPEFRMPVPVSAYFSDGKRITTRILVTGPETVAELPALPGKPDRVVFNDYQSVLAVVKSERW